jgi:hypothetical protein
VFPAIVDRGLFDAAQTIIKTRFIKLTDEELLDALRGLCDRAGVLSGMTIDEADEMPSSSAYRSRFGSLLRAYKLIGYRPRRDYRYIEINRALRARHPGIISDVTNALRQWGSSVLIDPTTDLFSVNAEFTASVVIAKCQRTSAGSYRWRLRFDNGLLPDITIVVRMAANNVDALDYYLLPSIDLVRGKLKIGEENGLGIDAYRFEDLNEFYAFVSPVHLKGVA